MWRFANKLWYGTSFWAWLLWPLSWCYRLIIGLRCLAYRYGCLRTTRVSALVIVVGNITVGGTGKTPLVIALAKYLTNAGYSVGIISRGYGCQKHCQSLWVTSESHVNEVGDEALLIVEQTQLPMVIDRNRVRAANTLIARTSCQIILSDDGLQHLALARNIEIAVIDGVRRFSNGFSLPAGPLRESLSRLASVDWRIANGQAGVGEYAMKLKPVALVNLQSPSLCKPLSSLQGMRVHAYAGIGHPQRFFDLLTVLGCEIIVHAMPDHHRYRFEDFAEGTILMTEKDAVKCRAFAGPDWWFLPVVAMLQPEFLDQLHSQIKQIIKA